MALSPWQKHVQSVLRQGGTMKQASKSFRAKGGKTTKSNPRGVPLSSKTGKYRPSVPKGPMKKVVGAVKKQYKKALAKASKIGRKKSARPTTKRRASPPRRRVDTASGARERAYQAVDLIRWPDGFCRRDIGWRALERTA